jgi:hypothetical protein
MKYSLSFTDKRVHIRKAFKAVPVEAINAMKRGLK